VVRDLQRQRIVNRIRLASLPVSFLLAGCVIAARSSSGQASNHPSVAHRQQASSSQAPHAAPRAMALESLGSAPLAFEAIDDTGGLFATRTPGYTLRVAPTWAELDLPHAPDATNRLTGATSLPHIRMRLMDAASDARVGVSDPLATQVTYLLGNNPAQWRANVHTYERVRYSGVYPGIDLVYYGTSRDIEHDFIVAPGSRPDQIVWAFEGADALRVRENGDLQIAGGAAPLVFRAPKAFQGTESDGGRHAVDVRYRLLDDNHVGFAIASYDTTKPLTIDPVLNAASTLGGHADDEGSAIAVDNAGNIYVAGITTSVDFPASGTPGGNLDVFVTKLNSSGTIVLSSTYIGGSKADDARALAVDASGNVYVAGVTQSPNFPTHTPLPSHATLLGDSDAFVFKLSTTGAGLIFSTYLGGTGSEEGHGIAIDSAQNVYVTGDTTSTDFPTVSPRQAASGGNLDAFVSKLSPAGTSLLYSTYLGGSDTDSASAIAADAAGNVTIVGSTVSTNFPVSAAFQAALIGDVDAFVTRLTPTGTLTFSTYLGGSDVDVARAVAMDADGNAFVTGSTLSPNFPTSPGAIQPAPKGAFDAFVTGVAPNGGIFVSTYLGGSSSDRGHAIAVDAAKRVYIAGQTLSTDFPATHPAQTTIAGDRDAFVVMLPPPYTAIGYSTYLGTGDNDDGLGVAADKVGRAYLTGVKTYSWPATTGGSDGFVMRLSSSADTFVDADHDGMDDTWEATFDPSGNGNLNPNDDPDGDGLTNLQEYQAHTHPFGFFTRYLAEGATGTFFDDQVALFNTSSTELAIVILRFQRDDQTEIPYQLSLPPHARRTIIPKSIPGLESANFSTVIEANTNVIVDRTMTWDKTAYGSHAETAGDELSNTWYLAEGSTGGAFDLFYLLQNPNATAAAVTITYLLPGGQAPIVKHYSVSAHSRFTIQVDNEKEDPAKGTRTLAGTDVSAQIDSDQPILVERAMYLTANGKAFSAGHDASGVTSPAKTWFLAEGATGSFFDMFILLANPNPDPTTATLQYLLPDGRVISKSYPLPPQSRTTINVDGEDPALVDTPVSTKVTATLPIVVERAMWWPSPNWYEAHDSAGAVVTAPTWALAEGQVGGALEAQTYVLIANTSNVGGQVDVTIFFEDDTAPLTQRFDVLPNSRFNVDVAGLFTAARDQRFATLVQSVGTTPLDLVVERAMYTNSGKVTWAAGTGAMATPIFAAATIIITDNGVFPKHVVIPDGTRVNFINKSTTSPMLRSDPHPIHTDCPAINLLPAPFPVGTSALTGNMVIGEEKVICGFHDHENPTDTTVQGTITIRP
jgi:hypothetical protein